jgi:structural maintenance of chromosomes protein 6
MEVVDEDNDFQVKEETEKDGLEEDEDDDDDDDGDDEEGSDDEDTDDPTKTFMRIRKLIKRLGGPQDGNSGAETYKFDPTQTYGEAAEHVDSEDDDEVMAGIPRMEATEELENTLKNRKPMDHGVILSFECLNFMCHKHLEVKLGPHLNFIIGRNGSGKSAVLTGLTICLGGKVQGTNRGKSLKDLIKDGTE